ncbi:glycosyltransferase [Streptomyces roseolus]|uniref:glycosyltransferase n=1 Tax=Streptomyces roseolus TaxID=67358 RepID=UPI003647D4A7
MRIVRLANFVTPTSGGLRTALDRLGRGYRAAGHEPVLVVPGAVAADEPAEQGRVITLPGPELPGTGGYRVLADRRRLAELLERLAPDRIEVSDRTTLRWTGEWARRARVPSVMVSHETADGVLRTWGLPGPLAARAADRLNRRTAWAYGRIVCTTAWAEEEFVRLGARNVVRAPLGVDLEHRRPGRRDPAVRARYAEGAGVLLLLCSRLSVEKRPGTAVEALARLLDAGVRARLVVAGDGPLRAGLERRSRERGLPVRFLGHVADREELADLQAAADLCLAPGPAETFGLSALEALACGTPAVVSASSALPEVVGTAGAAAADTPAAFADAVRGLLALPESVRRAAARARAEHFSWDRSVDAFLHAHEAATGREPVAAAVPDPLSTVPDPISAVPDPPSTGPDPLSAVPDPPPTGPVAAGAVPAAAAAPPRPQEVGG